MSTDRDPTRVIRSWLHEDSHEDADRVLHLVLAQVDTTPQRRAGWLARRFPPMSNMFRLGIAAAVVAIALVVGLEMVGGQIFGHPSPSPIPTVIGHPSPSPIPTVPPPAAPPAPLMGPDGPVPNGLLESGNYYYADIDQAGFNARITVPAGWTWNGRYLSKGGIGSPEGAAIFFFGGPVQVFADPCHWAQSPSTQATFAAAKVDALAAQPSRHATTPTERNAPVGLTDPSIPPNPNRWLGMAVDLTVPDTINFADCDRGQYRSWGPDSVARLAQGPGQHDLVWALDISGAAVEGESPPPCCGLIIDAATFAGTPADVKAEIDAILASIGLGHWG
jgi:hypothetical protein